MYDAPFGAREGSGEMSHLFDGPCAGDEGKRNPSTFQ
jgi:hypothetical protein